MPRPDGNAIIALYPGPEELLMAPDSEVERILLCHIIEYCRDGMHPTDPALAILDKMRDGSQSELIFPSVGDEPFSNMAMLAVLDRLGYGHVTVHGFRATFATWAEECTDYPDGVREAALAHRRRSPPINAEPSSRSGAS